LQKDKPEDDAKCDSQKLLDLLRPAGIPPPTIVVLSACRSAEASDRPEGAAPPSPGELAALPNQPLTMPSLGAQLVQGGVSIVIGMSGRVSDVAARLFTRRFEASLLRGQPLVSATADARRAPFVEGRATQPSIDWAYPTVLLEEGVDAEYAPTPVLDKQNGLSKQDEWVTSFRITQGNQPVFCARQDFFDAFDDLFRRSGRGMLVAYARPDDDGRARYGKTRLVEQLTFRALRAGHLPLVITGPRSSTPRTLATLVDALRKQQMFVTQHLGLKQPAHRLVAALKRAIDDKTLLPATIQTIEAAAAAARADEQNAPAPARDRHRYRVGAVENLKAELEDSGVTGRATCFALQYDLWALAEQFRSVVDALRQERTNTGARVSPWLEQSDRARAVLLLDNLDLYHESFIDALFELANQGGFGSPADPAPLVVTFTLDDGPAAELLRPVVEGGGAHAHTLPLDPFPRGLDMLVYQRVLLHPFNAQLFDYDGVSSAKPFAFDRSIDAAVASSCEMYFSMLLKGHPASLSTTTLYAAAQNAKSKQYLVDADDSAVLKGLGIDL
jgi:hypothetical protein